METWEITLEETRSFAILVNAANYDDACEQVQHQYENGEINLDKITDDIYVETAIY